MNIAPKSALLACGLAALLPAHAQDESPATTPPATPPASEPATPPATPPASPAKAVSPPVQVPPPAEPIDPAKVKTQSSYGLGYRTGGQFGQQYGNFGVTPDDIETETFLKGFLDAFKGNDPEVTEEDLGKAMQALGDLLQAREKELAAANLEAGKAFLADNGKKEGIVTTESGLQYQIIEKGGDTKYAEPKEGEAAKQFMVNYKGTLINGTEFDASQEGEPIAMTLDVVPGIKEALTMMPVGSKWKVFLPSELAYGEQRRSPELGPNAALIFDLELVGIEDAPPANPGGLPFQLPEGVVPGQ